MTTRALALVSATILATGGAIALAGPPQYTIVDLGVAPGENAQAFGLSSGGVAAGRVVGGANEAFVWTMSTGAQSLPNLASRPFGRAEGASDAGFAVGIGTTTLFGSAPLPLIWEIGVGVSQLPLPAGFAAGRAYDINDAGVAVGSVGGGIDETAVIFDAGAASLITQTAPGGSSMTTAFAINDAGLIAGIGIDPGNAARNVGLVFDPISGVMTDIGALPGRNGAIAFGISDAGHVTGSSMQNQGSGLPFLWSESAGMTPVPLPPNSTSGSGRAVNSDGWVVGTASGVFAVPFLYDGSTTYALQDLLVDADGWDLAMNTSSSATGISESGVIVGSGVRDGLVRAYAMIPLASPCPTDLDSDGSTGASDLAALISAWGQPGPADFDGSGDVGASDLAALLAAWGACP